MSYVIHEETRNGYSIKVYQDEDAENPRDWSSLGTLVAFGRNKRMGDDHDFESPDEAERFFKANDAVMLPVYKYEHSGVALSTESFVGRAHHAEWDSGQIGYIYSLPATIRENYNAKRASQQMRAKALAQLAGEIDLYSAYVSGDIFEWVVEDEDEDIVESCCGVFGYSTAIEEAQAAADALPAIIGDEEAA